MSCLELLSGSGMDVLPDIIRMTACTGSRADGSLLVTMALYTFAATSAIMHGMRTPLDHARNLAALALLAVILFVPSGAAHADEYYSTWGFSIDLPDDFEQLSTDGVSRYSFGSADGVIVVDIAVMPPSRFAMAAAGASATMKALSGSGTFGTVSLSGYDAAVGAITMKTAQGQLAGFGLFVNDAEKPLPPAGSGLTGAGTTDAGTTGSGTAGAKAAGTLSVLASGSAVPAVPVPERYDLIVLVYAPASASETHRDAVQSAFDGFSMRVSDRAVPGPWATWRRAGPGKAAERTEKASIQFGAALVPVRWSKAEAALAQEVVEREYRVMNDVVSQDASLVEYAVQRFYRMVFRDSAPSLDELGILLAAAWESGEWKLGALSGSAARKPEPAADSDPATVTGPRYGVPADPRGYATALLHWVQGYVYERNPAGSDVVNPITAAFTGRGDCDSRALVMSILLRGEGIRSILMISLKHEHALAAVDVPGAGARFPFAGGQWLVAETTAHVDMGRIDAAQANPADWIGVPFP